MPLKSKIIKKSKGADVKSEKSKIIKKSKGVDVNSEKSKIITKSKDLDTDLNKEETFELKLSECIKKCELFKENNENKMIKKSYFSSQTEDEYQSSFKNIITFSKKITVTEKNNIDCVMFHSQNEDGVMAAYYVYKYFENKKELLFIPTKPSSSDTKMNYRIQKYDSILKNKNLIILDLSFGKANYDYLSKLCKSIIIIDDHVRHNTILDKYKNIHSFIGDDSHCASVYTFKFLYPAKDVPLHLIYVDKNDRKLQLSFINNNICRYNTVYNSFKIINSPYLNNQFTKNKDFKKIGELLFNVSPDYKLLVGKLYDDLCNNIKLQVVVNSVKRIFCGHPVYILNYNDPVLYKMIGREM